MPSQCPDYAWARKLTIAELAEFLKKNDDELEWYLEMLQKEQLDKNLGADRNLIVLGRASLYLAHDLKNPLSVIRNATDLIKEKNADRNDETSKLLDVIEQATLKTLTHIDDVLKSTTTLTLEKNSVLKILNSSIAQMLIPSSIKINLPEHDHKIVCDALKMERVFINLIGNSLHAMDNKGTITILIDEYEDTIVIKIEDDGNGIPDEILPRIFDPLITTKSNGRGIGLAASKEIVEMHNGYIDVKSTEGLGTEFFITMPR